MLPPGHLASLPRDVLITSLIFTLSITTVSSIKCLQCISIHNPRCENGGVEATECKNEKASAKYCLKYTGQIQLGQLVIRDCGFKKEETACHKQKMEGEIVEVCGTTCETDGCNTANTFSTPQLTTLLPSVLVSFVYMLCVS